MALRSIDLMIGDWVLIHEPTCKGHRIDYINEMEEEIGADGEIYNVCDIKPIPLTPEILKKNGWWKCGQDFSNNNVCFELEPYRDGGFGIRVSADEYGSGTFAGIEYVHELQHALRLCGIEKEINL